MATPFKVLFDFSRAAGTDCDRNSGECQPINDLDVNVASTNVAVVNTGYIHYRRANSIWAILTNLPMTPPQNTATNSGTSAPKAFSRVKGTTNGP